MGTKPDVLLIVLDDLGLVDVTPLLMPRVTEWATGGIAPVRMLTRCYSEPVCSQARACLTYGRYGRTLGIIGGMDSNVGPMPPASETALAQQLRDLAGYQTALVGKWHGGPNPIDASAVPRYSGAPHARGFNAWRAGTADNVDDFFAWSRIDETDGSDTLTGIETQYATAAQLEAALAWWATAQGSGAPRFLQVSFSTPHGPYHFPPADELGGFVSTAQGLNRQKYESEIRSADWAVGQLLDAVGPTTMVVLLGDNGTPNNARAPGQPANRVKSTCYEGGVRVPLAIQASAYASQPGVANDRLVHVVDIPATILHAAGLTKPAGWDGSSIFLSARTQALCEAQDGASGGGHLVRCALLDQAGERWKLLRTDFDPEELYNLRTDPGELIKLSLTDPANASILATLRAQLYG